MINNINNIMQKLKTKKKTNLTTTIITNNIIIIEIISSRSKYRIPHLKYSNDDTKKKINYISFYLRDVLYFIIYLHTAVYSNYHHAIDRYIINRYFDYYTGM